jgi:hypothetical protein
MKSLLLWTREIIMIGSAILVIFLIYIPRDVKFYLCYVLCFSIFCLVLSAGTNNDHKKEMKCTCLLMFLVRDSYSSVAPTSSNRGLSLHYQFWFGNKISRWIRIDSDLGIQLRGELWFLGFGDFWTVCSRQRHWTVERGSRRAGSSHERQRHAQHLPWIWR